MTQPKAVTMPASSEAITILQPADESGLAVNYNGVWGRRTGIAQVVYGVLAILIGVAQIVLQSSVAVIAYGIWAGFVFYIPTGILGILSSNKKRPLVIAYMVMSIISAICATLMMIMGVAGAFLTAIYCTSVSQCYPWSLDLVIAADSLLAWAGLIEMGAAIAASAYCCGGVCKKAAQSGTIPPTQVSNVVLGPSTQVSNTEPQKTPPPPYNVASNDV